jgi:uncharacterized protein YkwD
MTSLASRWTSVTSVVAVLALMVTTLLSAPNAPAASAEPLATDLSLVRMVTLEEALLDKTNADRITNGLPALDFDYETLQIARERALQQLGPGSLNHYDEQGSLVFVKLLGQSKLGYGLAGENLARSTDEGGDVIQRIEDALMQSPTHRKNILEKRFSRAAIGMACDNDGRIAFAEIFRGD